MGEPKIGDLYSLLYYDSYDRRNRTGIVLVTGIQEKSYTYPEGVLDIVCVKGDIQFTGYESVAFHEDMSPVFIGNINNNKVLKILYGIDLNEAI